MFKPTATLALLLGSFVLTACSPSSDASEAESEPAVSEEAVTTNGRKKVTTKMIDVPVSPQTLTSDFTAVSLEWADLWRHTELSHEPVLRFEVSPRDGESCDGACLAQILARAAAHGGTLTGKLRLERKIHDIQLSRGVCARVLQENVTLDLRNATAGINADLAATYGFLTLSNVDDPRWVELQKIPCP